MTIILFIIGLIFLILGAEALVRGASSLASAFGLSPLVIGLTVVAFGTSSPELAVSLKGALSEQSSIALGNVVGSNIFNVLFILGISSLIVPLVVSQQLIRFDVPLMIVLSLLVFLVCLDELFSRIDGLIFFSGLIVYVWCLVSRSRKESLENKSSPEGYLKNKNSAGANPFMNISLIVIGLILLVVGSRWLVGSAVTFARYLGISELIAGLTIVAAGTSLPEVVTSIIAALRGERDIAVGNVVGSNIFNIMGVLALTGIVAPAGIGVSAAAIRFDMPVMAATAFACLPIFFTGHLISRFEGAIFLGYYVIYTLYLVLAATHHDILPEFSRVTLYFVIPLTVMTLAIIGAREFRRNKKKTLS